MRLPSFEGRVMRLSFNQHSGHEYVFVPCWCYPAHVAALRQTDPLYEESYLFVGTRFVCFWRDSLHWARASSFTRFLDHTQRRTALGTTPLVEWSARHRDLYLTTHNSHNGQTSMPRGGIRTHNSHKRAVADLRLRQRDHWDRPGVIRVFRNRNNTSPQWRTQDFFRGGSTNSVEDRGQTERGSGGVSPLVRGSGGSCNLVQEI